ncbi:MAG: hypothetical protein M2R45_04555 [Verrucomicrobia subdivision 3 bacterium]|nr:hypothetical protein [Limisphaerales bacterium]MCS1416806.1 hypothetical protein [Limisphaerales bacterium]
MLDVNEHVIKAIYKRQLRFLHEDLKFRLQLQYFDQVPNGESFFSLFPDNTSLAAGRRWDFSFLR